MFEVLQSSFKFSFLFFKDVKNLKYFVPGLLLTFLFYIVFDFKYFGYPSFSWDNIGAYFSFQAYYFLTFILLSPFLSQLSNDINEKEFGIVTPFSFYQLIKDLIRLLSLVLSLFLIQIGLTFGWWLLTFILPDFFSSLDVFFDYSLKALLFGFAFVDYSLERENWSVSSSVSFFKTNSKFLLVIGFLFLMLMNIPIIGLVIAPVISTVIGTYFFLKREKGLL